MVPKYYEVVEMPVVATEIIPNTNLCQFGVQDLNGRIHYFTANSHQRYYRDQMRHIGKLYMVSYNFHPSAKYARVNEGYLDNPFRRAKIATVRIPLWDDKRELFKKCYHIPSYKVEKGSKFGTLTTLGLIVDNEDDLTLALVSL